MKIEIASILLFTLCASAQTNLIYPNPTNVLTGGLRCGVATTYVNYTKAVTNGWGWKTNSFVSLKVFATKTNYPVAYGGKNGDTGCGIGSVTIPVPAASQFYRFTQGFPNGQSKTGTNAPMTIVGFNP
jgi:hypothetical protein